MEKKMSVNEIIEKTRLGRAINQAYVEQTVADFLFQPAESVYPVSQRNQSDLKCEIEDMKMLFGAGKNSRTFSEMVRAYYREEEDWVEDYRGMDLYYGMLLPSVGQGIHPYYQLNLRDYLEPVGMEEDYCKWFRADDEMYANKHGGKGATIHSVLKGCINIISDSRFIYPACRLYLPDGAGVPDPEQMPFSRKGTNGDRYVTLASEWLWLLLVKAQYRWSNLLEEKGIVVPG